MGSRKRQDLLSNLGAWGPWGRSEAGMGTEENVELNKNQLKKKEFKCS